MNDYKVTRFVSGLGYYCGIALVVLCAVGGLMGAGVKGLFAGVVIGGIIAVPFLMLCEGMHALVTIANNTKPSHLKQREDSHSHVA